jgi:MFS family permease
VTPDPQSDADLEQRAGLNACAPVVEPSASSRADLRRSMLDGTAFSVMVGAGELYLPAFILALSLGEVMSGLIATLPPLVGAVLQLSASWGVRKLGSHKRWSLLMVGLQAASFVPMALGALAGWMPGWAVFACAVLYWGAGMSAGASWSTWIGTLVPRRVRARFFGRRQRALQVGTLAGFLIGGLTLAVVAGSTDPQAIASGERRVMIAFACLFVLSAACRFVSWNLLSRSREPVPMPDGVRSVGPREAARRLLLPARGADGQRAARSSDARLIVYMVSVSFAACVSSPFVTPFVIEHLRTGYAVYAMLIGAVMLGKVVTLAALGSYAQRHGAHRLLIIGGLGIIPFSAMWAVSGNIWWLLGVQLLSGAAWACYELATWLMFLDHLKEEERTSLVSWYFLGNSVAMAAGSLLGGWLLATLGKDPAAYAWVFVVSTVLRAGTVLLLIRVVRGGVQKAGPDASGASGWGEGKSQPEVE